MAYFPMFVDISDKECLVVGGGRVAYRKAQVLLDYQARIKIVAKNICQDLEALASLHDNIVIVRRAFISADVEGKLLVIAATNDEATNRLAAQLCNEKRIPVNVVDNKALSSFILPSYVKEENLVAAFSSSGNSPALTQLLKEGQREILTPFLGQLNEFLGVLRPLARQHFVTEDERKTFYKKIIDLALEREKLPENDEVSRLLNEGRE